MGDGTGARERKVWVPKETYCCAFRSFALLLSLANFRRARHLKFYHQVRNEKTRSATRAIYYHWLTL